MTEKRKYQILRTVSGYGIEGGLKGGSEVELDKALGDRLVREGVVVEVIIEKSTPRRTRKEDED